MHSLQMAVGVHRPTAAAVAAIRNERNAWHYHRPSDR